MSRTIAIAEPAQSVTSQISRFYGSSLPQASLKCFWIYTSTAKLATPQMVEQDRFERLGIPPGAGPFALMMVAGRLHGEDDDTVLHVWVPAGATAKGEAEAYFESWIRDVGNQAQGVVYVNDTEFVGTVSGCTFTLEEELQKKLEVARELAGKTEQGEQSSAPAVAREQ